MGRWILHGYSVSAEQPRLDFAAKPTSIYAVPFPEDVVLPEGIEQVRWDVRCELQPSTTVARQHEYTGARQQNKRWRVWLVLMSRRPRRQLPARVRKHTLVAKEHAFFLRGGLVTVQQTG